MGQLEKLFKKSEKNEVVIKPPVSTIVTAEQVQHDFNTISDRFVSEVSLKTQADVERANRLRSLGFYNAKTKDADNYASAREVSKLYGDEQFLFQAANYFKQKYPQYKFITHTQVVFLCKKYDLLFSEVNNYIGQIPDLNLKQVEDFKIDTCDTLAWLQVPPELYGIGAGDLAGKYSLPGLELATIVRTKASMQIVAPQKLLNMEGKKVLNYQVVPEDPIVLQPVYYNKEGVAVKYISKEMGCYLIVTAWGKEAEDVVNEKMN